MSSIEILQIPRVRQPFGYLQTIHEADVAFVATLNDVIPFSTALDESEEKYITANEVGGNIVSFTLKAGHKYECEACAFFSTSPTNPNDPIVRWFSWYNKDLSIDATTGILGIPGLERKLDTTRDYHNTRASAIVDAMSLDEDVTIELKVKTVTDASTVANLDMGTQVTIKMVPNASGPSNENKS